MDDDKSILKNRILRYLRDIYNQNVTDSISEINLSANIGTIHSNIEDLLEEMSNEKLITRFKDLNKNQVCRILVEGIEYFEKQQTQSNPLHEFSLKLPPTTIKSKLEECLEEIKQILTPKDSLIRQIISEDERNKHDELDLLSISKHIRNILKVSYVDGDKRSQDFTSEGRNFYSGLQHSKKDRIFERNIDRKLFVEHAQWHMIKVGEFIHEIELVAEGIDKIPYVNTPKITSLYLEISEYPEPFYHKLIDRINRLYQQEFYSESLLLIRKLFENLVIDILKKKYPDESSLYMSQKGKHHKFHIIIKNLKDKISKGDFENSKKEIQEAILCASRLRDEGGKSSHSILIDIDKPYIDQISREVKHNVDLLIRAFTLIK